MWRQVVAHWVCRVNAVAGDPVDVPVPSRPPQVRGPAGRRPRLSASALHQTPDSADFVGIKTYLSPLPSP
jgi:hypothetical protein